MLSLEEGTVKNTNHSRLRDKEAVIQMENEQGI